MWLFVVIQFMVMAGWRSTSVTMGSRQNDSDDSDTGPNRLINFPVLAKVQHGSLIADGTYTGAPNQTYTLDFYTSESGDSSGYGPGQTWVGSTDVTTDATGNALFHVSFGTTVPGGHVVSATATNATDGTSEFSAFQVMPDIPVTPPTAPSSSEGQLADTGDNVVVVYGVAALLIGVGVAGIIRFSSGNKQNRPSGRSG